MSLRASLLISNTEVSLFMTNSQTTRKLGILCVFTLFFPRFPDVLCFLKKKHNACFKCLAGSDDSILWQNLHIPMRHYSNLHAKVQ